MATLHFFVEKAGSGKATFARQLATAERAIVLCEDEWMSKLTDPIENLEQYLQRPAESGASWVRWRPTSSHWARQWCSISRATAEERAWVRSIFEAARAPHVLHVLDVDDATCRRRVQQRNELRPPAVFFGVVTDQQLDEVNGFFESTIAEEDFRVVIHRGDGQ